MVAETGVEHRSPAKNHKVTFLLLALFTDEKRGKSHLRGLPPLSRRRQPTHCVHWFIPPLLKNTLRVHESFARAMRGECVRHRVKRKAAVLCFQQSHPYHACEHITRKSRADSCTHCLHARIIGLAGVGEVCTLTGWSVYFYFFLLIVLGFCLVGVGAIDDPHGRGEHCSPAKKHKVTFLFSYFSMTKSTKSHIRSFLPYVSSLHLPAMLSSKNHHPPVRT